MALLYKTIQSSMETKDGQKLFHPRAVHIATVGTEQLAKEIAEYSSLTPGDVRSTILNMVMVMTKHLQASESVTVDDLGTFSLIMRSRGKGAVAAADVSASQAALQVRFTPASKRNLDRTVATRSLLTGTKCVPYTPDKPASGGSGSGSGDSGDSGSGGNGGNESPLG